MSVNAASRPPITVVVPILDEEASLEELHSRLVGALPHGSEIIFVDDGSSDGTPELLRRLVARDPCVRAVRLRRNFGKSVALATGFRLARADVVATIDSDLQDAPEEIPRLAAKLAEGHDLVGGWRRRRKDPAGKVLASKAFNLVVSLLGGTRFRDINCGLKVFRREVVEDLDLAGGFHRFLPLLACWKGYRVTEMEVRHGPRRHGASRYGRERIPEGFLDLLVVMFLVRIEGRPSRYFAGLGFLLGLAGLAISAYLAWLRLSTGSIQNRFPFLALGLVLMVVGIQLFSLGLFGEILAQQFRVRRPFEPARWVLGAPGEERGPGTPPSQTEEATGGPP